jgi:hypothetical protein
MLEEQLSALAVASPVLTFSFSQRAAPDEEEEEAEAEDGVQEQQDVD